MQGSTKYDKLRLAVHLYVEDEKNCLAKIMWFRIFSSEICPKKFVISPLCSFQNGVFKIIIKDLFTNLA